LKAFRATPEDAFFWTPAPPFFVFSCPCTIASFLSLATMICKRGHVPDFGQKSLFVNFERSWQLKSSTTFGKPREIAEALVSGKREGASSYSV